MLTLIILTIFLTIAIITINFRKNKDIEKLSISLGIFILISIFVGLGNMTRSIIPLFIAHFVFVTISWGGLIVYIIRDKLYLKIIFLPILTLFLYVILVELIGSNGLLG